MEGSTTLRIFWGPDDSVQTPETSALRADVTLPLAEVLPLLTEAVLAQRTWLRDFEDDEVTISADLFEMLTAYRFHWRPSA